MGHPDNHRMNHVPGSVAAELVHNIFIHLQPDARQGIDEQPFPPPRLGKPYKVCVLSGELASSICSDIIVEYFDEGSEPVHSCTVHKLFAVDTRTGSVIGEGAAVGGGDPLSVKVSGPRSGLSFSISSSEFIETVVKAVFPPEYSIWATKQGYDQPAPDIKGLVDPELAIISPISGSRLLIDPETPRKMQTLPLRASVEPSVPSIEWYVNGELFKPSEYPYEARWPLEAGSHIFQAKFPRANIFSPKVYVTVNAY